MKQDVLAGLPERGHIQPGGSRLPLNSSGLFILTFTSSESRDRTMLFIGIDHERLTALTKQWLVYS